MSAAVAAYFFPPYPLIIFYAVQQILFNFYTGISLYLNIFATQTIRTIKNTNEQDPREHGEGKEAYEAPKCETIEQDAEFNLLLTDSSQQNPCLGRSTDSYSW